MKRVWPMDNKALAIDKRGQLRHAFRMRRLKAPQQNSIHFMLLDKQPYDRVDYGENGRPTIVHLIEDEGRCWCLGWEGEVADALRAAVALR